jgi:hypothetical protein
VLRSFEERALLIRVVEEVTSSPEEVLLRKVSGKKDQEPDMMEIPF